MFGWFKKKKYPVLTDEMIKPVGELLNTTEAKRVFKQFMKEIGYLDKDELSLHAGYLSDEIKDHESYLRDEVTDKKEDIAEAKKELKALQAELKKAPDDEKEDLESHIEDVRDDLEDAEEGLKEASDELAKFKKDKRAFLIEYINNETQNR